MYTFNPVFVYLMVSENVSTKLKEEIRKKNTQEKTFPNIFSTSEQEKKKEKNVILKYINTHSNHVVDLLSS